VTDDRSPDRHEISIPPSLARIRSAIDAELAAHLEERIAELEAAGQTTESASIQARREFGDLESARATIARIDQGAAVRDWVGNAVREVASDLWRTSRGLVRRPAFLLAAVLTLALGIGANAAMFGLVDRLLLSPPPHIRAADEVVRLRFDVAQRDGGRITWVGASYPAFQRLAQTRGAFAELAGSIGLQLTLSFEDGVDELDAAAVTAEYFPLLGVQPALGRFPTSTRDGTDDRSIVVSHALWTRRLGGSDSAIGRQVRIGGDPFTVIGVAPAGFTGEDIEPIDAWIALGPATPLLARTWSTNPASRNIAMVGRLAPGVPMARAQEEASLGYRIALVESGAADSTARVELRALTPGRDADDSGITPEAKVALWLQGVSALVLLVALANVTNLLLLRAIERRRETAVRLALGISRFRLLRHLTLESALIALAGGGAAVLLAGWIGPGLGALVLPEGAGSGATGARLARVAFGIAAACAAVMTVVPALLLRYTSGSDALNGSRGASRRGSRTGEVLAIAQVALTVVLLVGAGLFVRSILRLRALDLGYSSERVVAVRINPGTAVVDGAAREAVYTATTDLVRRVPGVEHVALSLSAPFRPSLSLPVFLPGRETLPGVGPETLGYPSFFAVEPAFFETLRIPLLRGRVFTTGDHAQSGRVALVDATMAATFWPGQEAIGQCFKVGADTMPCTTVIGVVGDTRRALAETRHSLRYYLPIAQRSGNSAQRYLFVRTERGPETMVGPIRTAIAAAGPAAPFVEVQPLARLTDISTRQWRLGTAAFLTFGVLATIIATIGLYGVISFGLASRERELGIRRALGESSPRLLRSIAAGGMLRTAIGFGIGSVLALGLVIRIRELLYQPSLTDGLVFVLAGAIVVVATLAAITAPSVRAMRVDPVNALRSE
jgi:predicted permease